MVTNIQLVEFVKKALSENWGYCLGSFGNILTPAFMSQKMKQGYGVGEYNTKHKTYLQKFLNKRVSDCYGLVKAFVWWNDGNVKYIASQDRNQEGAFNAAKEKGPISNIPEIPGLVLWMKGHAGIYIGGGEFIECAGAPTGMFKGKIQNGKVVSGSKFTHWFKDTYITYVSAPKTATVPVNEKIKIDLNGKKKEIIGYSKENVIYVKLNNQDVALRTFAEMLGLKVEWDNTNKVVMLKC
ncbi:MAG: hypothetical protein CVV56_08165 [Tenericutes bacterium HGW-Tenericutes-1]|jgi:hypothetical protein|nr:MAG: hypothetical protein CVV56_08165 [Tenericutes bacterium HGW-Tenericutes-1]PKM95820.1 MAG: hypothetical protein CVU84_03195 [Firmicutes bacterium HGW-Firmicutes-1]